MGLVTLRGHVRMQIRGPIVHENVQKGKQEMPILAGACAMFYNVRSLFHVQNRVIKLV